MLAMVFVHGFYLEEAAWPSGLRAIAPGSNLVLISALGLSTVFPDSTLPRFANNWLPPVTWGS